ncbi:MAG: CBS domain-containing protein [Flavobacteriales bacterium]|nr:CBS domain-containing protein [Flavobacteriales bacterium]
MQAKALISSSIECIDPKLSGEKALDLMDKYRINHLAIVKDNYYQGILSRNEILSWESTTNIISKYTNCLAPAHVTSNQHLFDIIEVLEKNSLSIVPVTDNNNKYFGVITIEKLIHTIAKSAAIQSIGGIIVLEMNSRDYTLTEIASIVESYNTKILSSYVISNPNSTKIDLTLKLDKDDISAIVKDFERRGYQVSASFKNDTTDDDQSIDRYESLMRFLNP